MWGDNYECKQCRKYKSGTESGYIKLDYGFYYKESSEADK